MIRGSSVLCLAAAALLVLGAQPASAAKKKPAKPGKVKTATATQSTTVDDQIVTATATCPKGTTAVGGGFVAGSSTEAGVLSDLNVITESVRAGGRAWRATAFRLASGAAGPSLPLTAEAYCRSNAGKVSSASASDSVSSGTAFMEPIAACPLGRSAVSGGLLATVSTVTTLSLLTHGGGPVGTVAWSNSVIAAGTASGTLETQVNCMKRKKAPAMRTASVALPTVSGSVVSLDTPACPAKLFPFGGGYSGPPFGGGAPLAQPVESRRFGSSWRISAINLNNSPGQLTAKGLCS